MVCKCACELTIFLLLFALYEVSNLSALEDIFSICLVVYKTIFAI